LIVAARYLSSIAVHDDPQRGCIESAIKENGHPALLFCSFAARWGRSVATTSWRTDSSLHADRSTVSEAEDGATTSSGRTW
jgi:hypothetical protein